MNRRVAWSIAALLVVLTTLGLILPLWPLAALALASLAALRKGRAGFLLFAVSSIAIDALVLALFVHAAPETRLGLVRLSLLGAQRGLAGGLRLTAVTGANLAVLSWVPVERLLDGLRLPRRATALLAAILIAAHDLAREAARLVAARRLDGRWPKGLARRAAAGAALLAPLVVAALRRAIVRRDALRLAGHRTPRRFAPLVAITALAVASRMVFLALPNLKPTFAIVFLGGLLFGPGLGAAAGLLSMAFTDVLLTGLSIAPFANAPAMALVGLLGGVLRGWADETSWTARLAAALCGIAGTVAFSVSSDLLTWTIVPELRGTPGALQGLVLLGLAFNVVPALANALLFAAVVGPVARAARAAGLVPARDAPREAHVA